MGSSVLTLPSPRTNPPELFCLAGHAIDADCTPCNFLPKATCAKLRVAKTFAPVVIADMDAWARIRSLGLPAGCGSIGVLLAMIDKIAALILGAITPVPQALEAATTAMDAIKEDARMFHPGAVHMFSDATVKVIDTQDSKTYAGQLGNFFVKSGKLFPLWRRATSASSPTTTRTPSGLLSARSSPPARTSTPKT